MIYYVYLKLLKGLEFILYFNRNVWKYIRFNYIVYYYVENIFKKKKIREC